MTLSHLPSFVAFDQKTATFSFQPLSKEDMGKFRIDITLSDGVAAPVTQGFMLKVEEPKSGSIIVKGTG
jgi:hypothetical protein